MLTTIGQNVEKSEPSIICCWEGKMIPSLWKNSPEAPQIVKDRVTILWC